MSDETDRNTPDQRISRADHGALADGLPPFLDGALRSAGLNTHDPQVARTAEMTFQVTSLSLPLPPPEILAQYEDRFPGLVNRMVLWTDEQRKHRMSQERERLEREERRLDRSQIFAAVVGIVGLSLSAIVATTVSNFGTTVVSWIVPCIIAIVSIGGPTAAVYLARTSVNDSTRDE